MLAAIGTVAIAGCLADGVGNDRDDQGDSDRGEPDVREPDPDKPNDVETWLKFGEWTERNSFGVMIEGVEIVDSVTLESLGGEAVHKFDPERMAIVDYQLKAIEANRDEYHPHFDLEVVVGDDVLELGISDTEFEDTEVCNDYQCFSGRFMYATVRPNRDHGHGYLSYEPGEKRRCWNGVLVPSGTAAADVDVMMDGVRWAER